MEMNLREYFDSQIVRIEQRKRTLAHILDCRSTERKVLQWLPAGRIRAAGREEEDNSDQQAVAPEVPHRRAAELEVPQWDE